MRRTRPLALALALALSGLSIFSLSRALLIAAQLPPAQQQAERNGRVDADLAALERRVGLAEKKIDELAPQVAVLVSDVSEMKWIARGGAGFIVVQVIISAFGLSARRRGDAGSGDTELA